MANIKLVWDGDPSSALMPGFSTTNYTLGATSGFVRSGSVSYHWTGAGLQYGTPGSFLPTAGTLYSWVESNGSYTLDVSGLNVQVRAWDTAETLGARFVEGRDTWLGDAGDNFFFASLGGDTYNGGAGIDTLDFQLAKLAKSSTITSTTVFRKAGSDAITFTGSDGLTMTLNSVERLRFTDVSVALDLDGNAGKVARLLGAVFGRDAIRNKEYVGIGLSLFDAGQSELAVSQLALDARLGMNASAAEVVNLLFRNVANSLPSAVDLQMFTQLLDKGYVSKAELAWAAAETTLNTTNIGWAGLAASGLDYLPFGG